MKMRNRLIEKFGLSIWSAICALLIAGGAHAQLEPQYDFGDAPDTYGTSTLADGARHTLSSELYLYYKGMLTVEPIPPDAESDGKPTSAANGDDSMGRDDEDYLIQINSSETGSDYGDANENLQTGAYPTTIAGGGASHTYSANVTLGNITDTESDGQPSSAADGDDTNSAMGADDEDGITFEGSFQPGSYVGLTYVCDFPYPTPWQSGFGIKGWIDFDGDGHWENGGPEVILDVGSMAKPGTNRTTFLVPADAKPGVTYARFRMFAWNGPIPSYSATGAAFDAGEVEDYRVQIQGTATPPTISISDASGDEGDPGDPGPNTEFVFDVTLSSAWTNAITVDFDAQDGIAERGGNGPDDYELLPGALTIPAGQTNGTITVVVNRDDVYEIDENFFVNLSNPSSGATLADSQGEGVILNDDGVPALTIGDYSILENYVEVGGEPNPTPGTNHLGLWVSLSNPSYQTITVQFSSSDITAEVGSDYLPIFGTAVVNPYASQGALSTLLILEDEGYEPDETLAITISNAVNATIADSGGIVTILNDDTASGPEPVITSIEPPSGTGWNADGAMFINVLNTDSVTVNGGLAERLTATRYRLWVETNSLPWVDAPVVATGPGGTDTELVDYHYDATGPWPAPELEFLITDIDAQANDLVVSWMGTNDWLFTLKVSTNIMVASSWSNVTDCIDLTGIPGVMSGTNVGGAANERGFYRVTARPIQ